MKILDYYILRKFLTSFTLCIILFTVIAVVIDTSEKADDFVKSKLSFIEIIKNYHVGFVPHIVSLLFPTFILISVVYFTSKMAVRSEVIAILSSGTSLARFLRPYWIGSIFLGLLLGLANNFLIPKANEIRTSFEARYVDPNSFRGYAGGMSNLYFRVDTFTYAGMRNYDTVGKSGSQFFYERIKGNRMVYNLRAENITWDTAQKNWRLSSVVERKMNGLQITLSKKDSMRLNLGYGPYDFSTDKYLKDKLSTPRLEKLIRKEELRGAEGVNAYKMELYRRNSIAVSVIIMTMIGAILASRKIRGGSGLHLAVAIVIGVSFEIFNRFSTVFSVQGNLPPLIAAWVPNFIFSCVAFYLYRRSPK